MTTVSSSPTSVATWLAVFRGFWATPANPRQVLSISCGVTAQAQPDSIMHRNWLFLLSLATSILPCASCKTFSGVGPPTSASLQQAAIWPAPKMSYLSSWLIRANNPLERRMRLSFAASGSTLVVPDGANSMHTAFVICFISAPTRKIIEAFR